MDNKVIQKIVKAFEIEAGKLVVLQFWGEDKDIKLLHEFSYELAAAGAIPLE